jgi:DNA-3-methyladenine glycosylase
MSKKIPLEFFNRETLKVAEDLIGKIIVRKYNDDFIKIRITEVEAYKELNDKASHSYKGKVTNRTKVMFGTYGKTYIYLIYGMYYCLNFVTEEKGKGYAVLIRSGEILEGMDLAAFLRYNKKYRELNKYQKKNISNGPGKLSMALNLKKDDNDKFLNSQDLYLEADDYSDFKIQRGKNNKEIAKKLYLSEGTVKNHITNIFNKLELRDRTQLAVYSLKNNIS